MPWGGNPACLKQSMFGSETTEDALGPKTVTAGTVTWRILGPVGGTRGPAGNAVTCRYTPLHAAAVDTSLGAQRATDLFTFLAHPVTVYSTPEVRPESGDGK